MFYKNIYIYIRTWYRKSMEDPTDIGMKNARWLDIWFLIGLVEVLDTLVSRHHLMPKFKYIDFFFFLLIKYIDLILVPLCILILKFLLNKKILKFFIYLYGSHYGGPNWYRPEECRMNRYMIFDWACWSFGHLIVKISLNAKSLSI